MRGCVELEGHFHSALGCLGGELRSCRDGIALRIGQGIAG